MPSIPSDRESKVVTFIRQMFDLVDTVTQSRTTAWQYVEERYRAFVNPTEVNQQSGKLVYPWDETVVIPYSYALVQAIVAYLYTLFTAQTPFKQIQDAHGDNPKGADLAELVLAHYDRLNRSDTLLYGLLLDACKYGIGAGKTLWDERWETRIQRVRRPVTLAGMTVGMTEDKLKQTVKTFDGPQTTLCDPWLLQLDPRVPAWDFQRGNFVGETIFTSWYSLKEHEEPYGPYVNLDQIPRWGYKDAIGVARQTYRLRVMNLPNYFDAFANEQDRGFVMLEQLWARIIPSDLDLGPGDRPEMWLFTLANRSALIQAEPVDLPHNKFPYFVIESSPDMHTTLNPGVMEILTPLQDFMDWLFNSHIQNVRKSLNDMFLVDPERIYLSDLLEPRPMKVIRLRPEFSGTDVKAAVQQLQVQDVTQQNMQDVAMIFDLMQRVSAALDALMGVPSQRRRTATESAGTMQLAANRLKVLARIISGMGIAEWGQQQLSLIQALMTEPLMVQIVGARKSQDLRQFGEGSVIRVSPEDIQGQFNFPIHDGSMPLDPVRTAETWQKALIGAAKIPEVAAKYDLAEIYGRGLQALGLRDLESLKRKMPMGLPGMQPQVMPDQQVMQGVQRGQLVPLTGGGGPNGAGAGPRPAGPPA